MAKRNALIPKSKAKTAYDLLSDVCVAIREEPKRFNQMVYRVTPRSRGVLSDSVVPRGFPECGTVGCVAGWVVTLKGKRPSYYQTPIMARSILGINDADSRTLFWYRAAGERPQTREHAKAGVKHVKAFMERFAAQLKATRV